MYRLTRIALLLLAATAGKAQTERTITAQHADVLYDHFENYFTGGERILDGDNNNLITEVDGSHLRVQGFTEPPVRLVAERHYLFDDQTVKDGTHRLWFDSGELYLNENYHEGSPQGVFEYRDDYGELVLKKTYDEGQLTEEVAYYDGYVYYRQRFENGEPTEPLTFYDPSGKPLGSSPAADDGFTFHAASTVLDSPPRMPDCTPGRDHPNNCARKLLTHLYSNLRYTADARENGYEGSVNMYTIIEPDGQVSAAYYINAPTPSLGEEAERVFLLLPKMQPGLVNGKPVRSAMFLPLKFKLE